MKIRTYCCSIFTGFDSNNIYDNNSMARSMIISFYIKLLKCKGVCNSLARESERFENDRKHENIISGSKHQK